MREEEVRSRGMRKPPLSIIDALELPITSGPIVTQ